MKDNDAQSPTGNATNTSREADLTLQVPSFFSNHYAVQLGRQTTRLTFGEVSTPSPNPHFRVSVTMTTPEVLAMARAILASGEKLEQMSAITAAIGSGEKAN